MKPSQRHRRTSPSEELARATARGQIVVEQLDAMRAEVRRVLSPENWPPGSGFNSPQLDDGTCNVHDITFVQSVETATLIGAAIALVDNSVSHEAWRISSPSTWGSSTAHSGATLGTIRRLTWANSATKSVSEMRQDAIELYDASGTNAIALMHANAVAVAPEDSESTINSINNPPGGSPTLERWNLYCGSTWDNAVAAGLRGILLRYIVADPSQSGYFSSSLHDKFYLANNYAPPASGSSTYLERVASDASPSLVAWIQGQEDPLSHYSYSYRWFKAD